MVCVSALALHALFAERPPFQAQHATMRCAALLGSQDPRTV